MPARIGAFRTRRGLVAVIGGVAVGLGGLVAATPAVAAPTPVAAAPDGTIHPADRASVLQAYQNTWVKAMQVPSGWTGSIASCTPGTDSAAAQNAVLKAVNFARGLVGRPAVTMDAGLSAKALSAALIQDASGTLNHTPTNGAPCYTSDGAAGSGTSNLFLDNSTTPAASAIAAYLSDSGTGNEPAGHRRWVLFSRLAVIGSGTTNRANALNVVNWQTWLPQPAGKAVAAWPSAGYFPAQLEPDGRWSVSIPGADFTNATVTVKHHGSSMPLTVISRSGSATDYGDNSLVWSLAPKYDISEGDQAFTVTVRGYVVGGKSKTTTYTTTLFDGTEGMAKRNVIAFPWPTAKKVGTTFDPGATNNNGLQVYYGSATPDVCRGNFSNPPTVTTIAAGTCSIFAYVGHDDRWPDAPVENRSFTVKP